MLIIFLDGLSYLLFRFGDTFVGFCVAVLVDILYDGIEFKLGV